MSEIRQLLNDKLLKVEPPAVVQQAPSPPVPAEDRQAVDQVFTQQEKEEESTAALLMAWQMLPLLHERHLKGTDQEEDEKEEARDEAR